MPVDRIGQMITFAEYLSPDEKYSSYVYIRAQKNDTIAKIAARKGAPELVQTILSLNTDVRIRNGHYLRSARQQLRQGTLIRLPGTLKQGDSFSVHCGNPRPVVKSGYAKYDTVDRPGRVGLNRFLGYDPVELDIAIQFEGYGIDGAGDVIEDNIAILEKMAGRGNYAGAADGPPSVIQVSVTDNAGNIVWLIPPNYQWSRQNPTAPLYRISGIAWSQNALSDVYGQRVRQLAVVTVKQYTPLTQVKRSATQRAKSKKSQTTVTPAQALINARKGGGEHH